jgi:hypothetical protein
MNYTFKYPTCPVPLTLTVDNIEVDGIDTRDYPDFADAFICSATVNGRQATDAELDQLQDNGDLVYSEVEKALY